MRNLDVIIVGAGPAGIGMALELNKIPFLDYGVLESDRIGESFRRWPKKTRLITPSFYSNPFGLADLNAVDSVHSPALFCEAEHLSGNQYADYLDFLAENASLPIVCGCKVLQVEPDAGGGFRLLTKEGELFTQFLIWACGEYQFPDLKPFPGANLCYHYAHIDDWQSMSGGAYTIIGGYESGLDAAVNLLQLNRQVRLLVRAPSWDLPNVHDPSQVLSPYTRERLREFESSDRLEIIYGVDVIEVTGNSNMGFCVHAADGRQWKATDQPILGTGFLKGGGAQQIKDLWFWDDAGDILLNNSAVFTYFLITFFLSEGVSRIFRLEYPEHVLLTMTIAARNAPLMLAVTMAALPGQPLVYAALVIGMLIEFPHLTALRRILLYNRQPTAHGDVSTPS